MKVYVLLASKFGSDLKFAGVYATRGAAGEAVIDAIQEIQGLGCTYNCEVRECEVIGKAEEHDEHPICSYCDGSCYGEDLEFLRGWAQEPTIHAGNPTSDGVNDPVLAQLKRPTELPTEAVVLFQKQYEQEQFTK